MCPGFTSTRLFGTGSNSLRAIHLISIGGCFVFSDSYAVHVVFGVKSSKYSSPVSHDYIYLPLEGENSIRLLHLELSKDSQSPLQATLLDTSINGHNSYEALSYTWGEPEFTHELCLPDGRVKITENLHSALRQLRGADNPRILWIDAVCINQDDDLGRGGQVALVGEIYKSAGTVLVWLGIASFETSQALEFMSTLSANSEHFSIKKRGPAWMMLTSPTVSSAISCLDTVQLLKDAISAHVHILLNCHGFQDSGSFKNACWLSNCTCIADRTRLIGLILPQPQKRLAPQCIRLTRSLAMEAGDKL